MAIDAVPESSPQQGFRSISTSEEYVLRLNVTDTNNHYFYLLPENLLSEFDKDVVSKNTLEKYNSYRYDFQNQINLKIKL